MICPRCNQDLVEQGLAGVAVHRCGGCSGVFLDHGELNRVAVATSGDLEYSTIHQEKFEHDDVHRTTTCPRCADVSMKKVEFNIHTGIILDYCDACRGFWLDGPELERINVEVRRLNDAAREQGPPTMLWFAHFIWGLPR